MEGISAQLIQHLNQIRLLKMGNMFVSHSATWQQAISLESDPNTNHLTENIADIVNVNLHKIIAIPLTSPSQQPFVLLLYIWFYILYVRAEHDLFNYMEKHHCVAISVLIITLNTRVWSLDAWGESSLPFNADYGSRESVAL